ncbi:alpha/beta hydrolase [Paracoccus cavernae]|uniref:alpha/beta hydrolase n=1 Tax=Paracoccus cavernae TaxID=1571207 RepID=UPI0035F3A4C4
MHPLAHEALWDPAKIDSDYNARATVSVAEFDAEIARYRAASDAARGSCGRFLDVEYDRASGQTIDIFGPEGMGEGAQVPVFIFVHGGYWRALSKRESAMMAGMLAARGIATVVVDYRLAPEVDLAEITREIRAATAFVWREGARFGLDPARISIGGSSAGGHLVGAVMAPGWQSAFGLPEDVVKFAMPISGLFELAPIARSFAQAWLSLDAEGVAALSPMRHIPAKGCPMAVVWAEGEPAGFRRQSGAYAALWRETGAEVAVMEVPARNHFSILMDLADPDRPISRLLLAGIEGRDLAQAVTL